MARLSEKQIASKLKTVGGWKRSGAEITKTFAHKDFIHAIGFVNMVALLAEKANHHPDIDIRWNTVVLTLSTHSVGGLTEKDFDLAAAIDAQ